MSPGSSSQSIAPGVSIPPTSPPSLSLSAATMAARLLSRSKTLARAFSSPLTSQHLRPLSHGRIPPPPTSGPDLVSPAAPLGSGKVWNYEQISQSHLFKSLHAGTQAGNDKFEKTVGEIKEGKTELNSLDAKDGKVISFSPLEGTIKGRVSGLSNESLKIKRSELAQKITYALIPALLLVSKTKLTTSLLIFSVYWQIYGFFKEIFLDYVHQEVTRKWVLVYFKLMLLILAKDMFVLFGLV